MKRTTESQPSSGSKAEEKTGRSWSVRVRNVIRGMSFYKNPQKIKTKISDKFYVDGNPEAPKSSELYPGDRALMMLEAAEEAFGIAAKTRYVRGQKVLIYTLPNFARPKIDGEEDTSCKVGDKELQPPKTLKVTASLEDVKIAVEVTRGPKNPDETQYAKDSSAISSSAGSFQSIQSADSQEDNNHTLHNNIEASPVQNLEQGKVLDATNLRPDVLKISEESENAKELNNVVSSLSSSFQSIQSADSFETTNHKLPNIREDSPVQNLEQGNVTFAVLEPTNLRPDVLKTSEGSKKQKSKDSKIFVSNLSLSLQSIRSSSDEDTKQTTQNVGDASPGLKTETERNGRGLFECPKLPPEARGVLQERMYFSPNPPCYK